MKIDFELNGSECLESLSFCVTYVVEYDILISICRGGQ